MIFVTVGTHEQSFERLIKEIDELKGNGTIKEDVFIQTGFTDYIPKNCEWSKLLSFKDMEKKVSDARIVITHGGPASFIAPLQKSKIPIVVPRQFEFAEHVNNHQVDFAKQVEKRNKNIIVVYDIKDLKGKILNYDKIIKKMKLNNVSNNSLFCKKIEQEISNIFTK